MLPVTTPQFHVVLTTEDRARLAPGMMLNTAGRRVRIERINTRPPWGDMWVYGQAEDGPAIVDVRHPGWPYRDASKRPRWLPEVEPSRQFTG